MLPLITLCSLLAAGDSALLAGAVQEVATGFKFTEGPLWVEDQGLLFSDIPADTIYRADGGVFRRPSGKSNGLTLDREGRIIACEHGTRAVTRMEKDGSVETIADQYDGKKFNSPNDVVLRSKGDIFFTDPPYGLEGRPAELGFSGVYRIDPDGSVTVLDKSMTHPNGLAFTLDEKTLYVGDSHNGFIRVYSVTPEGTLENGRTFCDVPSPDGMKTDETGRLWTTAADGVRVYEPDGSLCGTVEFPRQPTNCAFGEQDAMTLYVTAREAVYKVRTRVKGLRP